ncbi:relaxase/mobilization nuclease domain-containing protein (plasmid) [Saccharothrix sp. AJ9571]|nr:relaxase/mobilization nuclease domain-containing protein [Saccharothrix sp. AJ9571]
MIGRVVRGWRARGLLVYLFGPGRHHEHTDPHVVAVWDGCTRLHQPRESSPGRFDVGALAAALTAPAAAAGVPQNPPPPHEGQDPPQGPVWHCSLRAAPEDRELSGDEWAEVVADVLDRTGIAPRGDPGGCRWVAVRHAADHVHVAAVLVRQDTLRRVHPRRDYHRVREACLAAEQRYGLRPTSPADATAPSAPSRGEREKAARQRRGPESSREQLRHLVRTAAARATGTEEFLELLAADPGVRVRARRSPTGDLTGYAVAFFGDRDRRAAPVWFGGRTLAADLSATALAERWASAPKPAAPASVLAERRSGAWTAAAAAAEQARADLATDPAGIAHATGDLLLVLAHVSDPADRAPLAAAAAEFEHAARHPGRGQPATWSRVAAELRTASWRLARVSARRSTSAAAVLALLLAVTALVAEIAAWRTQQHQPAAAAAAERARSALAGHTAQVAEWHAGQQQQPTPAAAARYSQQRHRLAFQRPAAYRPATGAPGRPRR